MSIIIGLKQEHLQQMSVRYHHIAACFGHVATSHLSKLNELCFSFQTYLKPATLTLILPIGKIDINIKNIASKHSLNIS